MSPTRNMKNNSRMVRHINPWNDPSIKPHSYASYEDEFREFMVEAGLPVDKEPEPAPVEEEAPAEEAAAEAPTEEKPAGSEGEAPAADKAAGSESESSESDDSVTS